MKDFLKFLEKIQDDFFREVIEILTDTVLEAERIAKQKAPVETGTLRRSIKSKIDKNEMVGYVGTNLLYALPLEKGAKIRPKKAKKLWIPIGKDTKKLVEMYGSVKEFIGAILSKGGTVIKCPKTKCKSDNVRLVILNKQVVGLFLLKDEVEIPAFKYFEEAFNEVYPKMKKRIDELLKRF